MADYKMIQDIARASLLADFFAVRIEEEGLYGDLQQLLAKIKLAQPLPALGKLQAMAAASADTNAFIEAVKQGDLFTSMRELLIKIRIQ